MSIKSRKVKKLLSLCLAVVLIMAVTGCGNTTEKKEKGTKDVSKDTKVDVLAFERQLDVMVTYADRWLVSNNPKKAKQAMYAVTDLDGNGRWEIAVMPDGEETENDSVKYYQINKSGDGLEKCQNGRPERVFGAGVSDAMKKAYNIRERKFQFEQGLNQLTDDAMHYYLENSAGSFRMGDLFREQTMDIHGYSVKIPQYTRMSDEKKQKHLNQLIVKEVEKVLSDFDPDTFGLAEFDFHVKLNDGTYLSILFELSGMGKDAAHPCDWAETVNIDCDQEKVLSQTDILPKEDREWVENDIMEGFCKDIRDIGYRSFRIKNGGEKLLDSSSDWENIEVYRTPETIGVVIPTSHATGSYQIYEIDTDEELQLGVDYDKIDWDAYRYKMPAGKFKDLQKFMPVLCGEKDFTLTDDHFLGKKRQNVKMPEFFAKAAAEAEVKNLAYSLDYVQLSDITRDGNRELVLAFDMLGYFFLVLHREGDRIYGIVYPVRWFESLQTNGVYRASGGACTSYFYQLRFRDGKFEETRLGWYDGISPSEGEYYIGKKKVSEKAFAKWQKKQESGDVTTYSPFEK